MMTESGQATLSRDDFHLGLLMYNASISIANVEVICGYAAGSFDWVGIITFQIPAWYLVVVKPVVEEK
jgi:hypothetical protein